MIYSRADFLTTEDIKNFTLLDGDGWLMSNFKNLCAEEGWVEKTLKLPYFQGLKTGSLNPTEYGSLLVLDAYYCYNCVTTIQIVKSRMYEKKKDYDNMLDDMEHLVEGYIVFAKSFLDYWHLGTESTVLADIPYEEMQDTFVVPTNNAEGYADFERSQARTQEPILGLITLFTCYEFWPMLFGSFGKDIPLSNVYRDWILGNQGGSSAKVVDSMVERYFDGGHCVDDEMVKNIFRTCLNYEYTMFKEM